MQINNPTAQLSYSIGMHIKRAKNAHYATGDRRLWLYVVFPLASQAFVIFGLFGAYMVAARPGSSLAEGLGQTLSYLVSPWMLATEAIAIGFLAFGYVFLKSSPWKAGDASTAENVLRRQRLRLLLAQALFALALMATGGFYAMDLVRETHRESLVQMQTLARVKADLIDNWLYQRSIDTELVAASLQQFPLERWSADPEVPQIVSVLMSEFLAGRRDRVSFALLSPDGKMLASRGQLPPTDVIARTLQATSPAKGLQIVANGPTRSEPRTSTVLFAVPIKQAGGTAPIAVLALTLDPVIDLLSQVQAWPVANPSGQIVVVRRIDDDLLLVTPTTSTNSTGPDVNAPDIAASQELRAAILQADGAHESRDYRGVEVIAASARVRGIDDWCVVAKIDRDAVMAGVHRRIETLALIVGGAILLVAMIGGLLWQGQRAGILSFREQHQAELSAVTRHYESMASSVRDPSFLTDAQGNFLEANAAAIRQYGYSLEEFRQMKAIDLRAPEHRVTFEQQWSPSPQVPGRVYETVHRRKDGTTLPVEVSNNAFEIHGTAYTQAFIRDLSERRSLEMQVARLSRVQQALFNAGGVLLRAQSEAQLFRDMCRILVQDGGYRLATVGKPNHDDDKTIRFVTAAGAATGYLDEIRVSWGRDARGAGPTGTAIREGIPQVNQDFTHNPKVAPWREAALKWNIQASFSLPLRCGGPVIGALTIYAEQPNAFDAEEAALLTRFAENIGYGLEKLRNEKNADARAIG